MKGGGREDRKFSDIPNEKEREREACLATFPSDLSALLENEEGKIDGI